jgi:hypothetical protein
MVFTSVKATTIRLTGTFLWSVAVLLFAAAVLKIFALMEGRNVALRPDPVFSFITGRSTSALAVLLKLLVLGLIFSTRASIRTKLTAILWLASLFGLYRLMWRIAVPTSEPCPCFGLFWQQIGLKVHVGNVISLSVLGYWAVGSIVCLGYSRSSNKAIAVPPATPDGENSGRIPRGSMSPRCFFMGCALSVFVPLAPAVETRLGDQSKTGL